MLSPTVAEAIASAKARVDRSTGLGWLWMRGYAKVKIESDWIYPQLCERIEPGSTVLDLGSGIGLLGLILEEMHLGHSTLGIEWDGRKVAFAQKLIGPESSWQVRRGDILEDPWPTADVVVLVDVLHYFPEHVQRDLLRRIIAHLEPGGALFLRVMNRDATGRARFTRVLERVAVAFRWNHATTVHWRSLKDIQDDLVLGGMQPALCLSGSHLLDGNCLIVALKP